MRIATMAFAVGLGLLGGCGLSPQQACKEAIKTICEKLVTCLPPQAKMFLGITDQASCERKQQEQGSLNCDNAEPCQDGETYDAKQAQVCIDDVKRLQCSDLSSGDVDSKLASCNTVCK